MTVKCHRLLKSNCIHSAEFVFCICWYFFFYVSQRDSLWFKSHKATSFHLLLDIQMQNVTLFHYNVTILVQIKMFLVVKGALIEEPFKKVVAPQPQTSLVGGQMSKMPSRGTQRESLIARLPLQARRPADL